MQNSPEGKFILEKLQKELPAHLVYHNLDHTLDVYHCAESLAAAEKVTGRALDLLLVAALFHDSGYLKQRKDHEAQSCNIAREVLPIFGYIDSEIETICSMIMATRIPQRPHNLSEQILCDADLDYLGRNDFAEKGKNLYQEMYAENLVSDEAAWDAIQLDFLNQHHYFTRTSIDSRNTKKQDNVNALIKQK